MEEGESRSKHGGVTLSFCKAKHTHNTKQYITLISIIKSRDQYLQSIAAADLGMGIIS